MFAETPSSSLAAPHLEFWKRQLTAIPPIQLPVEHIASSTQERMATYHSFTLSPLICQKLESFAQQHHTNLFGVLLAGFKILLHRYSAQEDIAVGTVLPGSEFVPGALVMSRTFLDGEMGVSQLLESLSQSYQDMQVAIDVPLTQAWRELSPGMNEMPLQVLFSLNSPIRFTEPGFVFAREECVVNCDLYLELLQTERGLDGRFLYPSGLFRPETVARMSDHFAVLLNGMLADDDAPISKLPILSDAERQTLIFDWNQTHAEYPAVCIQHLFEAQVERTPHATAVVMDDERLTYQQLNEQANQLAYHLRAFGVGPDTLVGICLERSLDMIVGLLGILKAGGAYLPLDPTYPRERLAFMLQDSGISILITHFHLQALLPESTVQYLCLDRERTRIGAYECGNLHTATHPENLAYTIYTSGSTGQPKGVQITHRNVVNLLCSMQREPGCHEKDVLLSVTTLSFDIAGVELYLPLISGAQVVLVQREVTLDGKALLETLKRHRVTIMQATPVTWRLLLDAGWQGQTGLKVLCGGEAMPPDLAAELFKRAKEVWNLYGPTETTIYSTIHRIQETNPPIVAIGRPIANTQIYLLDKHLQPVPMGVPGELCIAGDGVARGYSNRAQLSAEKFISNPFDSRPGVYLYKTGDLARFRQDGTIDFLGRLDQQIKLRGFRIEPGEIEAILQQHALVKQAVVVPQEDATGDKRLVAYLIANAETAVSISDAQLHPLPNQMPFASLNASEVNHLYERIYDDLVYSQYGISINEGDCVLDVGANVGLFTLFAHQCNRNIRVYAFEPVPEIFDVLKTNIDLYGLNVVPLMYGLSSKPGSVTFTYYPRWSALSGMYGNKEEEEELSRGFMKNQYGELSAYSEEWLQGRFEGKEVTCELRTLSEFIAEHHLAQIDLLKMNVEKSELEVLLGIQGEDWPKIRQLVVEVHATEGRLESILSLLKEKGYEVVTAQDHALKNTALCTVYAWMPSARQASAAASKPALQLLALCKKALSVRELRHLLSQHLPDYMIPSAFVVLKKLPLTANGKIDRKALPLPNPNTDWIRKETAYVAPKDELETRVAEIWRQVLNIPRVGVCDNFFDLGGNSLMTAKVHQLIQENFPNNLSMVEMFRYPTIRTLVERLHSSDGAGFSTQIHQDRATVRKQRAEEQQEARQRARLASRKV
jgi:amino acid adenylation domain-containing protein/FkbM family methyltransferase